MFLIHLVLALPPLVHAQCGDVGIAAAVRFVEERATVAKRDIAAYNEALEKTEDLKSQAHKAVIASKVAALIGLTAAAYATGASFIEGATEVKVIFPAVTLKASGGEVASIVAFGSLYSWVEQEITGDDPAMGGVEFGTYQRLSDPFIDLGRSQTDRRYVRASGCWGGEGHDYVSELTSLFEKFRAAHLATGTVFQPELDRIENSTTFFGARHVSYLLLLRLRTELHRSIAWTEFELATELRQVLLECCELRVRQSLVPSC